MKTCYEMLYTPKEQDWPSFQMRQIGFKKKWPYQQIVGLYLHSNWLLRSMLHFFLKSGFFTKIDNSSSSKTPNFKIFKYEWAMVNSSHGHLKHKEKISFDGFQASSNSWTPSLFKSTPKTLYKGILSSS